MALPTKPTLKPYSGQLPDHGNPATWVDRTTDFWTWATGDGYNNTAQTVAYAEGAMAHIDAALNGSADMTAFMTRTDNPHAVTAAQLGDYEEGAWLPSIGGTGGVSGQTYQTRAGRYVKVGKLVNVQATIQLTAKGAFSGNYVCLHGLPFAPQSAAYSTLNVSFMSGLLSAVAAPSLYINPGSVIPYFIGTSGAARSVVGFPQSAIGDSSFVLVGGSYIASS